MIARMKKLSFLIYHKEYEAFLEQLRALGVVHVVEKQRGELDEPLQQALQRRALYKTAFQEMQAQAGEKAEGKTYPDMSAEQIVTGYEQRKDHIQELNQQLPAIGKDIAQLNVWGDFDWQTIKRLDDAGWHIRFYACPTKEYDAEWGEQHNALVIKEENAHVYFVTVTPGNVQAEDDTLEPLRLPSLSLGELRQKRQDTEKLIAQATEDLQAYCCRFCKTLGQENLRIQENIDLMQVRLNSEWMADGAVVLLEGWIPEDNEPEVRNFLDASDVYYQIRKATKEDNAPIKLKNNAFVRLYEVLTKMYGMPDYAEFDPTPIIAPFFTLFFAFCMGDAGYGLVLIALGFVLKRKLSKSLAGMMNLVISLGIGTTVIGAIFGTFFGVSLMDIDLPEGIKQFMITGKIGDTSYDKQMLLALLIGVVHVCLAMTIKAIVQTVRFGFKEAISNWGWLLLVIGFICTGGLSFFEVISANVTQWAFIIIGSVAGIGIYLLNNLHRNVFLNIGAGLWDTYNMATGLGGDVLSYIRLYALGLAGGMLGGVFNQIAFMVNDAAGPVIGWLLCGLILVFGHALNIAMSCLSAFVHPLRLTFVEYFKNSGYEGKGEAYKPFAAVKE